MEKDTACFWKNNVKTDLLPVGARTSGIFVVNDDVYVAGYFKKDEPTNACYWKNGTKIDLPIKNSYTSSIFVKGNDVFIAGHYTTNNQTKACYWKNGLEIDLSTDSTESSFTRSIEVSGNDVYVAGFLMSSKKDSLIIKACYWANGVKTICEDSSCLFSNATSIVVNNNNIYTAGHAFFKNIETGSYWVNGKHMTNVNSAPSSIQGKWSQIFTSLEHAEPVFLSKEYSLISPMIAVNAISIWDSVIYIAGYYSVKNKAKACYWKNGSIAELPTVTESSQVLSMYVNGSDIYLAGNDGGACYWKNETRIQLQEKNISSANTIFIAQGQTIIKSAAE